MRLAGIEIASKRHTRARLGFAKHPTPTRPHDQVVKSRRDLGFLDLT